MELAKQLLSDASKHILLGSRSIEKGEAAVKDLQSLNLPGAVELLQIDVADEDSINAAAKRVESKHGRYASPLSPTFYPLTKSHNRLDALVNNAAIALPSGTIFQSLQTIFRTNVSGAYATVEAFAPLLSKSTQTPRIINVTSGAGSISLRLDHTNPHYSMRATQYRVSKAALNMASSCQAVEYGPLGWKVFLYCPGFTESNLGPTNKVVNGAKPTSEGAAPMVKILNGERDAEHAGFLHDKGQWNW